MKVHKYILWNIVMLMYGEFKNLNLFQRAVQLLRLFFYFPQLGEHIYSTFVNILNYYLIAIF